MRLALLGDHPDGVAFAVALCGTGRHQVVACTVELVEHVRQALGSPALVRDTEEVLADPAIEAVVVAGRMDLRAEQLRRVLQSERHAACVHPCGEKADTAHEAAMVAQDGKRVVFPLLVEGLHPAFRRLPEVAGEPRLVTLERTAPGEVLDNAGHEVIAPSVPGWDVLRAVGGEVAEVWALGGEEGLEAGRPVLLAGRFIRGALFQMTLLPLAGASGARGPATMWRLVAMGASGMAELTFPQGWAGPSVLEWREDGQRREEYREAWDAWAELGRQFEVAVGVGPKADGPIVTWDDEVRSLELDDAARQSGMYQRLSVLDYQEANEEVGFKGTMALGGCLMLWVVIGLLIASVRYPWAGWLVLPLLLVFMGLQFLRYIIPQRGPEAPAKPPRP
jgi:predicted dehydrogenase